MNSKNLIAIAIALALVGVAASAQAQIASAGLSGQCYDADASQGGDDELSVDSDGNAVLLPGTTEDPTNVQKGGAVPALLLFATESINDGGQTGNACKHTNDNGGEDDYLEVHAQLGDTFLQVCYNGQLTIAGECPTSPAGA